MEPVLGARISSLTRADNEARFDLQDRWLSNMDRDVLAWLLRYSPPTQLDGNELVTECETPLEREQMKQVLLKTMLSRGAHDKKTKKARLRLLCCFLAPDSLFSLSALRTRVSWSRHWPSRWPA